MIKIRLLLPSDRKCLTKFVDKVDKDLVGMYTETEELVDDWINNIITGIWEIYVAELVHNESKQEKKQRMLPSRKHKKCSIVGLITLYGDWQDEDDIQKGEFDIGISVAEQYQKKGIGKELLSFIVKRGKELGYEKATLWTRSDNQPMLRLAKKFGFEKGRKKTRYGFEWIHFSYDI